MASLIGGLLGAVIGSVFFGGLFGWIIHKLFRLTYSTADAVGLLALITLAGFTNASSSRSILATWVFYFVAAVPAYFILEGFRLSRPARSAPPAWQHEPPMESEPAGPEQSALAAEIEPEGQIALPVRAGYRAEPAPQPPPRARRRAQNFIARHWRGELSLPVSYWLISFAANIAGALIVLALTLTFTPREGYEPTIILALLSVTWAILLVLLVWQIVGLWRSAERRAEARFKARRSAFWARAAQFMAVIAVLQFGAGFAGTGAPQFAELYRIVFQNDPDIPDATLRLSDDGRFLAVAGGIKYGLAGQVDLLLKAAPNVVGLLLDSPGGRLAEAIKVSDLVRGRSLDTFVSDECSSACTLVFVAGRNRLVGQYGRLGFHGSYFPGMSATELQRANEELAGVYRSAGLSADFLARALQVAPESMWYPTREELRRARVTIGAPADVAALPDGFIPEASLASVREKFLTLSGVYEAIDVKAPDHAAKIYAFGLDYANGNISADLMTSSINGVIAEVVRARLSSADDATLVEFAVLIADEYAALLQQDATACFRFASGTGFVNLGSYLSKELLARDAALNERVIRSTGTAAFLVQSQLDAIWAEVGLAMQTNLTQEQFDILAKPVDQIVPSEHASYCTSAALMMTELSKLPVDRAASAVRSLYR